MKDTIFFDIETTGVNTTTARIVQIAAIKVMQDGTMIEKDILVNPQVQIPKEASDIHGITNEMVADKPTFKQLAKSIASFFEGCVIAGYNSDSYDVVILAAEFERAGVNFDFSNVTFLDMLKIERLVNSHKLGDTYKRYTGEELDGAHNALNDVRATLAVFEHQKQNSLISSLTHDEIDLLCQGEKKRFDIAGKMYINAENVVCWAFGQNIGKDVRDNISYCEWFLRSDFPLESKNKLRTII